jgi:hypothetical protein
MSFACFDRAYFSLVFLGKIEVLWQQFHVEFRVIDILWVSRFWTKMTHGMYLYCTPALVWPMLFPSDLFGVLLVAGRIIDRLSELWLRGNAWYRIISTHCVIFLELSTHRVESMADRSHIICPCMRRPNYKNVSTKTITAVIKFLYLSSHNPGSLEILKDFKQLSIYKPRP